jgi:hypothetical protein
MRRDTEGSGWLAWSIYPAVLSGIASICTSALAAFRHVSGENTDSDADLKMPLITPMVPA